MNHLDVGQYDVVRFMPFFFTALPWRSRAIGVCKSATLRPVASDRVLMRQPGAFLIALKIVADCCSISWGERRCRLPVEGALEAAGSPLRSSGPPSRVMMAAALLNSAWASWSFASTSLMKWARSRSANSWRMLSRDSVFLAMALEARRLCRRQATRSPAAEPGSLGRTSRSFLPVSPSEALLGAFTREVFSLVPFLLFCSPQTTNHLLVSCPNISKLGGSVALGDRLLGQLIPYPRSCAGGDASWKPKGSGLVTQLIKDHMKTTSNHILLPIFSDWLALGTYAIHV